MWKVLPILCAMNDGKEANLSIFFGKQDSKRLYFCSEGCRQRYGLIGVSRIAMGQAEVRKLREAKNSKARKKQHK